MKRIAVFCGSSSGTDKEFERVAFELGQTLADRKIGLVYGGAQVGLMGAVANGTLNKGGEVIGVLPSFLRTKEVAHESLSELHVVDTMHVRKTKMSDLSDGFIALPGGIGTLEELFEILTWAQLGLHEKPIGILNVKGFYDPMLEFIDSMVKKGFLKEINQQMVLVSSDIETLLQKMETYIAPAVKKWITKETT